VGKKLIDIFEAIRKEGDISAQMRLATKTGITIKQASASPDSPENLRVLGEVYKELTGKNCPIY